MNISFVQYRIVAGCVLGLSITTAVLSAQAPRVVDNRTVDDAIVQRVFERPVTIQLENVKLKDALYLIGVNSGVRFQAAIAPLDAVARPVSLDVNKLPLGAVLTQVLHGTGLRPVVLDRDVIEITSVEGFPVDQGTVVGKVIHAKTKQPIVGATVFLDDATEGVATDSDGTFRLSVSEGAHRITVRAVGFVRATQQIDAATGRQINVDFVLEPSASVLDEVIVTGTVVATRRREIATPITVVTAEDIEKRGITRIDQLFRGEIPGLLVTDYGTQVYADNVPGALQSSRIYSRGSAGLDGGTNPIKTYVDGVELLDPSYLGTLDPKSIERIEIVTGPQAATIYGSGAMGGVMQIFTKKGAGHSAVDLTLTMKYGVLQSNFSTGKTPTHNHAMTIAGGSGADLTYAGSLSYLYSGQWQPGIFSRTYSASLGATHTRGPVVVRASFNTTAGTNGTAGTGQFVFTGFEDGVNYGTMLERQFRETGLFPPNTHIAGAFSGRQNRTSNQTMSLNTDYRQSDMWQHHLTLGRSQNAFELEPQRPVFDTPRDSLFKVDMSSGQRITASYNTTFTPRLPNRMTSTLTVGGNGSWGRRSSEEGCLPSSASTSMVGCFSDTEPEVTRTLNSESSGAFGSLQVGFFQQLFLTLGLRVERSPSYGREHKLDWTPTNGLTYTMEYGDLTLKLLGSYGRATRPPLDRYRLEVISRFTLYEPSQYVSQFEAQQLTPEYSRGPQGGIELYYGNLGSLTINHYRQTVSDLIQRIRADSIPRRHISSGEEGYWIQYQYQNVATVRQQGWEGTGSLNLGPIALKGTYAWNDSRVISINESSSSTYRPGETFKNLPTHTGSVTASYAYGGSTLNFVMNYVGQALHDAVRKRESFVRRHSRLGVYLDQTYKSGQDFLTPGYVKSDLAASHRLTPWASATLNVTNLGNSVTSDAAELFPTLGRQTMVGLSVRFP